MTCSEFKGLIKDYIERRLSEGTKREFEEHLINCALCKSEIGENIASILSKQAGNTKDTPSGRNVMFFIAFIILLFLALISIQYMKIREYQGGELRPISREKKREIQKRHNNPENVKAQKIDTQKEPESDVNDVNIVTDDEEDFSSYSYEELEKRLQDCKENKDYKCVSSAALFLTKKSEGEIKKRYLLDAIEAYVEQASCASAMLQIMLLFKENPSKKETIKAHLLNAECYAKEGNFAEARKILKMIEKDAQDFKEDIKRIKDEIEKGEKHGEQTERSKGVQDRDSP